MTCLVNGRVVLPRTVLDPGWVQLAGHEIAGVGRGDPYAPEGPVHDLGGRFVLPGFVDLHMHGGGGAQITTDDSDEISTAIAFHARHGTTRTLASLVTDDLDRMIASVGTIAGLIRAQDVRESPIAGVHLEGPFLNPAKRGSHHSDHLLAPNLPALRALLDAGDGTVRVVTLAPELPGGMDLLREVVSAGAIPAVGHTDATFTQARTAFAAGARIATHLFNAMRQFHHRDPGPAGAALADETVTCELINDGVHVHDDAIRIAVAAAGPERIAFVTDATPAAGMTSGRYQLGPVPVFADRGTVRLEDGSLAGSTLTMDATLRRAVLQLGIPLVEAARAAATTPAHVLGLSAVTGSIAPGKAADLVVLDGQLRVEAVLRAAVLVHGSLP